MQISHAIFESNALSVIQALTSGDLGGEVGHILHDIKSSSHSFSVVIQFHVGMILFQVYHKFYIYAKEKKKNKTEMCEGEEEEEEEIW